MKIYFLSSTPCALTLNGVFFGVTDTFERFAELTLADGVYARFSPEEALPIGFFITEEIVKHPPLGCEVYLLKDGVAIYACDFPPADFTLRPVAQKREGELVATVYKQGGLQLSVQSPQGFFNATLPPSFASCTIDFHCGCVLLKGEKTLGIYSISCERLLVEEISSFEQTPEGVNATLPLADSLQRVADCSWRLSEKGCVLEKFTLRQPSEKGRLPEGLLAYAFFESVLLKGNFRALLGEELQADCERILDFLGEYLSVILTSDPNTCGLVRKKAERLFAIDYLSVEIREGKIVDIRG